MALKALDKGCRRRHRTAGHELVRYYEKANPAKVDHYRRLEALGLVD